MRLRKRGGGDISQGLFDRLNPVLFWPTKKNEKKCVFFKKRIDKSYELK